MRTTTIYSLVMVLYYICSGIFLRDWGFYTDWFSLVIYLCLAFIGLLFQIIYTREVYRAGQKEKSKGKLKTSKKRGV